MEEESGGNRTLYGVIAVLVVALVLVFLLWQQDQQTKEVELEVDTGDASVLVEPGPRLAATAPRHLAQSASPAASVRSKLATVEAEGGLS